MSGLILRGVLLPLIFFTTLNIHADDKVSDLYDVFYKDLKSYSNWVKSDKNNTFKDIFIDLYNLPSKKKRKYSYKVDLKVMESFSDDRDNTAYTYLEFKNRMSVNFVIWGIKSGSVKINGAERGKIRIENDTGFALLKGTFEKGVYFISFKIDERFRGVPIIFLSNKKVNLSQRGFNRKASNNAKIYNIKARYPQVNVSRLYSGFCFPYDEEKNRGLFYFMTLKEDVPKIGGSSLFYKLFQLTINEKNLPDLKKQGFNEKQLKWWKERMFKNEVCSYER